MHTGGDLGSVLLQVKLKLVCAMPGRYCFPCVVKVQQGTRHTQAGMMCQGDWDLADGEGLGLRQVTKVYDQACMMGPGLALSTPSVLVHYTNNNTKHHSQFAVLCFPPNSRPS